MKNKGFSLIEIIVVAVIGIGLLSVVFGVFITGRNSWSKGAVLIDLQAKTRLAMDRMVRELSSSEPTQVTIDNCGGDCAGQMISFRIPVAVDGSIYDSEGNIRWGAEGTQDWTIQYFADNDHNLIRRIPENVPVFGACCAGSTCYIETRENCEAIGNNYRGDGTDCSPNPCMGACCFPGRPCKVTAQYKCAGAWHRGQNCTPDPCSGGNGGDVPIGFFFRKFLKPALCFAQADNETILATDIRELGFVGTPGPVNPHIVKIYILAQRTSILGEPVEIELHSTVTFRNKAD